MPPATYGGVGIKNILLHGPDWVNFLDIQFFYIFFTVGEGTFHRTFSKLPFLSMTNVKGDRGLQSFA